MVNTEIRLIIFFISEYEEDLYSQEKKIKDQRLSEAQIMNPFLPNSD